MAKKKSARKSTANKATTKKAKKRHVEQYEHAEAERLNNPPVGLVTPDTEPLQPTKKTYQYDPHLDPQLVWAGKAEHISFEVPTVSLHVRERIDPRTIIKAVQARNGDTPQKQLGLFEDPEEQLPRREAIEFYKHKSGWSNRLVAGDSLLVMNSLLEKEGMAGKVQMIYLDPPYGIRYGSNFQPFVGQRDVKDRKDTDLTAEPEMLRAFRDTWELGIHSYLTYLRDRLLLVRELLHESGSVFVQISDENLHHVRELMDEVFGEEHFIAQINVKKSGMMVGQLLKSATYYLVWYGKEKQKIKYRQLILKKIAGTGIGKLYDSIESPDGTEQRRMEKQEIEDPDRIPDGWKAFQLITLTTGGFRENTTINYDFRGKSFHPGADKCWRTTKEGLDRLDVANRIQARGKLLYYKTYLEDFPGAELTSIWSDVGSQGEDMQYVVQTPRKLIERCMMMTTDPGDLVLDPTCGSGTTAYVAEQWGRRWITCDTSRVAITLAKQRLLTSSFDYYELAHPQEGIASGFVYKTVPHVTLKSIANNPEIREGMTRAEIDAAIARYADQETLYDQPKVDKSKVRVTGPFTLEAVPAITVESVDADQVTVENPLPADASIARSGATARQEDWRSELLQTGVRGKGGAQIEFARLEPLPAMRYLHAVGETKVVDSGQESVGSKKAKTDHQPRATDHSPQRVVVSFGPDHAPSSSGTSIRPSTKPSTCGPSPIWSSLPRSISTPRQPRTSTKPPGPASRCTRCK